MQKEVEHESEIDSVGILDLLCLRDKSWQMPLIICVVLHAGMQFGGLNAVSPVDVILSYFGKRKQGTKVTFLGKEQIVSVISK